MRTESIQQFVQLCETFLPEVSSSMGLITGKPGGKDVVQYLHQKKSLSHNQDFENIPKISWSELKDNRRGAWVIILGDKGVGAIKATHGSYESIASTGADGGQVYTFNNERGGNNIDFLKSHIGNLRKFYTGKDSGELLQKQRERQKLAAVPSTPEISRDTLLVKFKPLWAKAITAAIADSKGHVANMVKNDAFEKAKRKLVQIETLQNALEGIEAGTGDVPSFVSNAVQAAILQTASHFYPEETGTIRRGGYGSAGYESQFREGPRKVLQDITSGDTSKLGTILAFFKRNLISG